MFVWLKRYMKKRKAADRIYEKIYEKNEAQIIREKVSLEYDLLRSLVK